MIATRIRRRLYGPRRVRWQVGLLLVGLTAWSGCAPTAILIRAVPDRQELKENELRRDSLFAGDKIAMIDVDGPIYNGRSRSLTGTLGENPVALFTEKMHKAADDDQVKAVVLRLNTPGGGVTASEMMHHEIDNFRAQTGKPVIAAMLDVTASGGYHLACACDEIWAQPSSITGSIGVIMMTPNISETLKMIGVRVYAFTSGPMKDSGSPFRPMEPADEAFFQDLVNQMYADFLRVVENGRPNLTPEQIRKLADGRVYLGKEAVKLGLVDHVGSLDDAVEAARQRAGLAEKDIVLVQYARPIAYRPNIYAQPSIPAPQAGSPSLPAVSLPPWLAHSTPQFLYLWSPGW